MENKYVPIENGLPEPNLLLVIFILNPDAHQLPFKLAFFSSGKFAIIGGEPSSFIEREYVSGYHYILDREGNQVKAV